MKKVFSIKRVVAVAAAVCCLTTTAVFACGAISSYINTVSKTYSSMPTSNAIKKDVGYKPKTINSFSNGFSFKDGAVNDTKGLTNKGKEISKYSNFSTVYTTTDGQQATLYTYASEPTETYPIKKTENYKGSNLVYREQVFKFVPLGYKLSAEEQKAMKDGTMDFSEGASTVSEKTIKFASWKDKGIYYMLMADTKTSHLSQADMFNMAKELINTK